VAGLPRDHEAGPSLNRVSRSESPFIPISRGEAAPECASLILTQCVTVTSFFDRDRAPRYVGAMSKDQLLDSVRALLDEVLRARFDGTAYAKLSRAHGYADGYMRCLIDAGLVDRAELLQLVGATRRAFLEREGGGAAEARADAVA
jgi:hypothetical protein